jgi:DNA (cytosine-5)-methyltransferase 1
VTFGSLFSGIGGFDLGLERAGLSCRWQVELDPHCGRLLASRWPDVERWEDVRAVGADLAAVDLICGGFPCQDLSVAGQRAGLAGGRSGLWFDFHRILAIARPQWVLIENVPGLLSSQRGADFATLLRGLVQLGYGVCWRILDAQYFRLAQRRRRVFIVGSLGSGAAASVLFEPACVSGHPAPRREARTGTATPTVSRALSRVGGGDDPGANKGAPIIPTLTGRTRTGDGQYPGGSDFESGGGLVSTLRVGGREQGACSSSDNTPLVAVALQERDGKGQDSDTKPGHLVVAMSGRWRGAEPGVGRPERAPHIVEDAVGALDATKQWTVADPISASEGRTYTHEGDTFRLHNVVSGVRRLTPRECERLQGFPDDWTAGFSDSVRYRMLGNAVAVPVAEWIGRRIAAAGPASVDAAIGHGRRTPAAPPTLPERTE